MNRELEILCVGNELLIGKTLNTNAFWIAKRATSLGMNVKRVTIVGDYVDEIAAAMQEALRRRPRLIITTGGLGPTFDDKTLEGIAVGLKQKLEVNEEALGMIIKKYEEYLGKKITKNGLTPARVKMATLPKEAKPLFNSAGTAPGVLVNIKETCLVALPGVPPEMEAIFENSIVPLLKKAAGKMAFYEMSIHANGIVESALAPLIDSAMHDNPNVYVKSHVYVKSQPECEGKMPGIELHFSTTATRAEAARESLQKVAAQLADLVVKNGGNVRLQDPTNG